MEFNHFLSCYMPDPTYGGKRIYQDMIEQAVLAERLGYRGIAIPEHHLINILMLPSPLQLAVKLSMLTRHVRLISSIAVLPVRDMRIFAGEVVQADLLTDHRLVLGVGRGAFPYEVGRLGTPIEETREKMVESLDVLEALLNREEVAWDGQYYQFEPLTIMPRPERKIPLMVAAMAPEAIYGAASKGYDIQTTPLSGNHSVLLEQVDAFNRGKAAGGADSAHVRLSLQRGMYLALNEADRREKLTYANEYYKRFENIRGPGIVSNGVIEALPRTQTMEQLAENLLICEKSEMIDRLSVYAEAGIDEMYIPCNYGQPHSETMEMMERFSEEVMTHFQKQPARQVYA